MLDYSKIFSTFSGDDIFIIPIDGEEMEKENLLNAKESDTNVNKFNLNYTAQNYINNNKINNIYSINNSNSNSNSNCNCLTNNNININSFDNSKKNPCYFNQSMCQNQGNNCYICENNNIINNKNIIYGGDTKINNELFLNCKTNFQNSNTNIYNNFTSKYLENNWKDNIQLQLYKLKNELRQKVLLKMSYGANYGNNN